MLYVLSFFSRCFRYRTLPWLLALTLIFLPCISAYPFQITPAEATVIKPELTVKKIRKDPQGRLNNKDGMTKPDLTVKKITVLDNNSGRLDWSPDGTQIVYDKIGPDGFADLWIIDVDGMHQENLTDGIAGLPGKHMGQPAWHLSGEWIVFQAEKAVHFGDSASATPGVGKHNDLWIIKKDGTEYYQLTSIEEGLATLHPHFSHDGTRLLWGESADGPADWVIKIADFVPDPGNVHLENEESLRPGDPPGPVFYETHGFSPDATKIIFSAPLEPDQDWTGIDIYTYNLITQKLQRLTTSFIDWDEHDTVLA